jgi:hypothetical protein
LGSPCFAIFSVSVSMSICFHSASLPLFFIVIPRALRSVFA